MADRCKRAQQRDELTAAREAAAKHTTGDAYLRLFARYYRMDPVRPKLKHPAMNSLVRSGYPDIDPLPPPPDEALAAQVGEIVLRLTPDLSEVFWARYLSLKWYRVSNTSWCEHLRYWKVEQCADALHIPRATFFRRLKVLKAFVEEEAELRHLAPPPTD